jgi:hypothetical protein
MNDFVFFIILVIVSILIFVLVHVFSGGNIENITWEEGDKPEDAVRPPKRIQEVEKVINTKEKEDYDHGIAFIALVLMILGFVLIIIVFSRSTKKTDITSYISSPDTNSVTPIVDEEKQPANEEAIQKVASYFDLINSKNFENVGDYFAPQLDLYFNREGISKDYAVFDVTQFWTEQLDPSGINFDKDRFEANYSDGVYTVQGEVLEKSSMFIEKVPYWNRMQFTYKLNSSLKIISIEGKILDQIPDYGRMFDLGQESADDIRDRNNKNDFNKIFTVIRDLYEIRPSLAKRYQKAFVDLYGNNILIRRNNTFYNSTDFCEKFLTNKSIYLGIVTKVESDSDSFKIVSID